MNSTESPDGALTGIRVLDLSRILSGPLATMVLADLGADVIKVEDTKGGDDTRHWGPPFQGTEASYFLAANRNKRGVSVDLKTAQGREFVLRLADRADVLVENFRPGSADRLGLGYPELSLRNPGLVYASISGYGQTGPWASRPGYDAIAQAQSGMMSITGEAGGPPMRPGIATADIGAGMWATIGILTALYARRSSGRGQHIDISLLDGQLAWLTYVAGGYFTTGVAPGPHGTAHPTIVPYEALAAADGHVMIAAGNDRLWRRLTETVGLPDLAHDPRFATNPDRVRHRTELIPLLESALARRDCAQWAEALNSAGVPCAPISTVEEALTSEQAVARAMVQELHHPTAGQLRTVASPLKLSGTPASIRTAPPLLGQHTDEVLAESGYSAAEIAELHTAGAVR
ncbi:CaiB/BaiF CoA transferase family protein [Streptomyces pseudovenezuelae]|uniref:Crotonobetainyl-CoA:carnitine CoA-transferase CaiB-like acyl-CoA transferase n=1 Tax=Streptomyces pseudovenezuelae TaxID=67350 RepID=A0ABT6LCZ4_9ACTN|nr:CoA transferase [Streptomyces pseudovenezuelae]MDH6214179.1 crotonobetainyl-CoA:carnitine CoA-transferase CaiB-like acyl-CoA transferase [Streptomyces pseudovenezuelae]